jgi:hypothetical protein
MGYACTISSASSWGPAKQKEYIMKTNIVSAVAPALVAIAAILLSFRSLGAGAVCAEAFCALGVAIVMALDYRTN